MSKKIGFIALFIVVVVGGLYFYTSYVIFPSPKYCKVCHYMAPFYKKWETSTHNKVPCLKCHDYKPMKAIAGQFMFLANAYNPRPLTNVPDSNCLQSECHDKRLVESKTKFTKRGITFDHKPHFAEMKRGIKLHCRSCHSDIVQGEHVKVSMNVCFLCHFKGVPQKETISGCPSCHEEPKQPIDYAGKTFSHEEFINLGYTCNQCHTEITKGDGLTPREKCYFCHVERTERYSDVNFMHDKHVAKKQIDCLWCHSKIEHGKVKIADAIPLRR
jgi:nitrate/TMAO reductase-like tetraheme cytochrome c subunit